MLPAALRFFKVSKCKVFVRFCKSSTVIIWLLNIICIPDFSFDFGIMNIFASAMLNVAFLLWTDSGTDSDG